MIPGRNHTSTNYPRDLCLHELIEAQAARFPDRVAVEFQGDHLTYGEMNARANLVARRLKALGVSAESRVAICVGRSCEMVVGLLAVLKAGGAYVPLDPAYPEERLAFMLDDSQAVALLTTQDMLQDSPSLRARAVYLEPGFERAGDAAAQNLPPCALPSNIAYVIYTSGSTGKPKGVQIQHGSLINFLTSMQDGPGLTSSDVFLSVTTISFDIAGLEIYLPLITGARLVIASREVASDALLLLKEMERARPTVMQATPATWRLLVEAGWQGDKCLKVLSGGESLPLGLAIELLERGGSLWNLYGPTETTIYSARHKLDAGLQRVAIGRPIANTQIHLLDNDMQAVAAGTAAELFIGGEGLARGYLNRPELTAEKFVPDPFGANHGARLYNTGDLARVLDDGAIEYIQRVDNQIKLRGFRIELGEIETALENHPHVAQAVAKVQEDANGHKRLVAYIVNKRDAATKPSELRDYLRERLPDYMIPAAFRVLDKMPLTPNNKVDRKALPAVDSFRQNSGAIFVEPATAIESRLAEIWKQVLGLEEVGAEDNLFELGGDSFIATQIISRLKRSFNAAPSLKGFFDAPTVRGLAGLLPEMVQDKAESKLPAIERLKRPGPYPLSFTQRELYHRRDLSPDSPVHNIAFAMTLKGDLNVAALEQSLAHIVKRHEALRTSFIETERGPAQLINDAPRVNVPVIDLRGLDRRHRQAVAGRLINEECRHSFNLAQGMMLLAKLIRVEDQEHVGILTLHHLSADAWSVNIFTRELSLLYTAFATGAPHDLPEPQIQYVDFAQWQMSMLNEEIVAEHLAYWKQHLSGASLTFELPADRPRKSSRTYNGAKQYFEVPAYLAEQARGLGRREQATLFMVLLAAFDVLLYCYTGRDDFLVGVPVANRDHPEIEGIIGFFSSSLALRADLKNNPAFRTVLARVREAVLLGREHQDLPFEMLVAEMQPSQDASRSPLFQVMFSFQNLQVTELNLHRLSFSPIPINNGTAQFDLFMNVHNGKHAFTTSVEYSTDIFEPSTISRLFMDFLKVLDCVTADPDKSISEIRHAINASGATHTA